MPLVLLVFISLLSGCGYRIATKNFNGGQGQTFAVPTFVNRTTSYRVEQRLSEAVRQELVRRTRYNVVANDSGDVVMAGDVLAFTNVPVTFDVNGRASTYEMLVDMKVVVTDSKTHKELYHNDRFTYRQVFEIAQNPADFIREDPAALDRLSRLFAESIVATLMHANLTPKP